MLAIHGLNHRPSLAYDLFLVSETRVLSIFHLRLPAVLCVRFHAPVVKKDRRCARNRETGKFKLFPYEIYLIRCLF
jgi:hypothetical protein